MFFYKTYFKLLLTTFTLSRIIRMQKGLLLQPEASPWTDSF